MVSKKTRSLFSRSRIIFTKNIVLLIFSVSMLYACSSSNTEKCLDEFMEIYFFMGLVDANFPCNRNVESSHADDHGDVKIPKEEYVRIMRYIHGLQKTGDIGTPFGLCLQCVVHSDESQVKLSIGQFHEMTIENEMVYANDSLIYALRKYSGFYNYYNREDVATYCPELTVFGIPNNYQDLSASLDTNYHLFAKIRILAE